MRFTVPLVLLAACGRGDGPTDASDTDATGVPGDADTDDPDDTDLDDTDPADTDTTGTPDCVATYTDALGPAPVFARPAGEIVVNNTNDFPHVLGAVAEGPPLSFHVEADREGFCRLVTWEPSNCAPACEFGSFCVDGTCRTPPARVDAGDLTLAGDALHAVVPPDPTNGWFLQLDAPIAGAITATAAGGEVPGFSVEGCAVSAVSPTADWSALLEGREGGEDVVLSWSPVDPSARIALHMTTGVATHGGIAHAEIECEGPDTGSLTLPGAFLDALYGEGWSCGECGWNTLYRYRSGSVDLAGAEVRLTVRGGASFGYIPR